MTTQQIRQTGSALVATLLLLTLGGTASATFVTPDAYQMWQRADPSSTYQEWDVWTTIGSAADVANVNPNGNAAVSQSVPGAVMVAGSGNLYAMGGDPSFSIVIPDFDSPSHTTSVLLQIETIGNEFVPGTVLINGQAPSYSVEFGNTEVPGFGGQMMSVIETLFSWNGLTTGSDITIEFDGTQNMSLSRLSVDTSTVPEPGTALLMLIGLTGLACQGRRKA